MVAPRRLSLAHLPTPLEPAPRFSAEMAPGVEIWIKRDDCTGLAFGGNKARKLEFLMASARDAGADTVVTFGGVQSNHARMTAAAARKLGLDCHLLLAGSPPEEATGNLLLDRLLGATLTFMSLTPDELTPERLEDAYVAAEERLRRQGKRPYRIGPGGSTATGVLGYLEAFEEMMQQAARADGPFTRMVVGFGTGGTLAGLAMGNLIAGRPLRITGISVAPPGMPEALGVPPVIALMEEGAALRGRRLDVSDADVEVRYEYAGKAYAAPTTEGMEAIRTLARTEGIFLEPVYTAKAMAGLVGLCGDGTIRPGERVIFVHTGGTPGLFPYSKALTR